jgi:hypothetical protein
VTAPGAAGLDKLEIKPGAGADEIEQAVTSVLTGLLDIADSVEIHISGSNINVLVNGPRLHYENVWYYRCMGSPIASIIASIASEGTGKPIRITQETYQKGKSTIQLEVLG